MAKPANLYARIEPEVKERAESILSELEKGYADMRAGRVVPAKKAFDDIRGSYQR